MTFLRFCGRPPNFRESPFFSPSRTPPFTLRRYDGRDNWILPRKLLPSAYFNRESNQKKKKKKTRSNLEQISFFGHFKFLNLSEETYQNRFLLKKFIIDFVFSRARQLVSIFNEGVARRGREKRGLFSPVSANESTIYESFTGRWSSYYILACARACFSFIPLLLLETGYRFFFLPFFLSLPKKTGKDIGGKSRNRHRCQWSMTGTHTYTGKGGSSYGKRGGKKRTWVMEKLGLRKKLDFLPRRMDR